MSKIKLALDVVEGLKDLANNIETLVRAMENDETSEESIATEVITTPTKQEPISTEMVRAALAEKSQSGKQLEVKALITKYGGSKLTDLNPACYEELLKEAEAL